MIELKKLIRKNTKSASNDEIIVRAKEYNKVVDAIQELQSTSATPFGVFVATLEQEGVQDNNVLSGPLRVGARYEILTYEAGDDFSNVGASTNAPGTFFFATNTTPVVWTNGTKLADYGDIVPKVILNTTGYDFNLFHQSTDGNYEGYFMHNGKYMLMDSASISLPINHYFAANSGYTDEKLLTGKLQLTVYNTADTPAESILDGLQSLIIFTTTFTVGDDISMTQGGEFAHPK